MNTTPTMWPARPYIGQMMIKLLRDNMMIDGHHIILYMARWRKKYYFFVEDFDDFWGYFFIFCGYYYDSDF